MVYVTERFILSFTFLLVSFKVNEAGSNAGTIDSSLADYCKDSPKKVVNLMLELEPVQEYVSWNKEKVEFSKIKTHLIIATQKSQHGLLKGLNAFNPPFKTSSYWIVNRIRVADVTCRAISAIASIIGVSPFFIKREEVFTLQYISQPNAFPKIISNCSKPTNSPLPGDIKWGVKKINATEVWNTTKGEGIVVANIDTGVNTNHTVLNKNWRPEYGWLNGSTNSSQGFPKDGNGHGSHTMGTIAGQNGTGVAPGAIWIACQGCNSAGSCASGDLLICSEWMACPYTRVPTANGTWEVTQDCTKSPHIVSNSWGELPIVGEINNDTFFRNVTLRWIQKGMCPIFAIGNTGESGLECAITSSPGNREAVTGVGATNVNDTIACFSSTGPAVDNFQNMTGILKPDLSAPGVDVTSAWIPNSDSYNTISGTSMATPHVAGAFALLYNVTKDLGPINVTMIYKKINDALKNTAYQRPMALERTCNTGTTKWPNNVYGYGRIDVLAAVKYIKSNP